VRRDCSREKSFGRPQARALDKNAAENWRLGIVGRAPSPFTIDLLFYALEKINKWLINPQAVPTESRIAFSRRRRKGDGGWMRVRPNGSQRKEKQNLSLIND